MIDGPAHRLETALSDRYRIERELGEGGMATVYLADDLKHERKVALKVLKPELAAVVGAERFLAEIKTTANLQHPHILPLFDSGQADGFLFYVMPYVEGESLRDRLDREKQLGVKESVAIARKVADALDYAHGRGVVHRDIKPANILVSARGEPLVADFGIALAVAQAGAGRVTETGLSLGTPHYMSPEQATGDRDIDPRSDVYALGCVLYEMLAGQPPFSAPSVQAVLVQVLTQDATPITSVRRTVPAHVEAVLARALEKLPADRFETAADFAVALENEAFSYHTQPHAVGSSGPAAAAASASTSPWYRDPRPLAIVGVLTVAAAWGWARPSPTPADPPVPFRAGLTDFEPLDARGGVSIAISRDGSRIATRGRSDGGSALFVRSLDELDYREVPGSMDAGQPTFSPDGRWLAFDQDGLIKRVELSGGTVLPVVEGEDAHWGTDDLLVFMTREGIWTVTPTGGSPSLILSVDSLPGGNMRNARPHLLPDGQAVLFQSTDFELDEQRVMMVDVATGTVTDLGLDGSNPRYAASGHLVYGYRGETSALRAVPFDLSTRRVTGEPATVLLDVTIRGGGATQFVVSETGTAFYGTRGTRGFRTGEGERLLVVDLDGTETPVPLEPRPFRFPRWSPDRESVAYQGSPGPGSEGASHIFTYNVELRTGPRQLTFEGRNFSPVWSPDGSRLVFASEREGTDGVDLFVKTLDDAPPGRLVTLPGGQFPTQWPREDLIVFEESPSSGGDDDNVWVLELGPDSAVARPYFESEADQRDLMISPTGELAAYRSNESGTAEIYVRSFPTARQPEVVSRGGGTNPFWSPDGRTLYYWTLGFITDVKSIVAARIDPGPPFTILSADTVITAAYRSDSGDLHPDGDRMILTQDAILEAAGGQPLEPPQFLVVTNWFEELRERLGGG